MDAGITAFKAGHYADAVGSFRRATQLEPANEQAHLYLGTAYASQVIPNLNTPENRNTSALALAEFDVVLHTHPDNLDAIRQEASIYRNIKEFEKAKLLEKRAVIIDPANSESFYTIGVIDWMQAYKNAVKILADEDLRDDGVGNIKATPGACETLRSQNEALVEDAITSLTRAVEINPTYSDAMQYLNLIYRRRADLHCQQPSEIAADLKLADLWSQRAMEARKQTTAVQK
jgi:tetratricopeptide (TPR) repeat protein